MAAPAADPSAISPERARPAKAEMVARQRAVSGNNAGNGLMSRAIRHSMQVLNGRAAPDDDEVHIDFGAAGLYLVGLQTTVATVGVALVSIACCYVLPRAAVSAVRTLAITACCAAFAMRAPLRFGRVRGVLTIFNALRPCIVIYILVLVVEQLFHTCVPPGEEQGGGGWRHVVFHAMTLVQLGSGLVRARSPRSETDLPFLLTVGALLVVGLLPPASTTINGPLCGRPSLFDAGERVLRALLFASVYVIHTYCSAPRRDGLRDLALCVMRGAAAAIWIFGAHALLLCMAPLQAVLALWARFGAEEMAANSTYRAVDDASDGGEYDDGLDDLEAGGHGFEPEAALASMTAPMLPMTMPPPATETDGLAPGFGTGFGFQCAPVAAASASPTKMMDVALDDAHRSRDDDPPVSVALIGSGGGGFRSLAPLDDGGDDGVQMDAPPPPPAPDAGSTAVPIDPRDLAALTHTPSLRPEPRGAPRPATLSFALSMGSANGGGSAGGSQASE